MMKKASQKPQGIFYSEKFFDYDQVDYYFTDIEDDKVDDLYDDFDKSRIDKIKFAVIIGKFTSKHQ